jgi:hypothetical protein
MQYNLKITRISNYADQMLINILYLQSMLQNYVNLIMKLLTNVNNNYYY